VGTVQKKSLGAYRRKATWGTRRLEHRRLAVVQRNDTVGLERLNPKISFFDLINTRKFCFLQTPQESLRLFSLQSRTAQVLDQPLPPALCRFLPNLRGYIFTIIQSASD